MAEYKGGFIRIRPEKIIVTSNYLPEQCFTNREDIAPILRRFRVVEDLADLPPIPVEVPEGMLEPWEHQEIAGVVQEADEVLQEAQEAGEVLQEVQGANEVLQEVQEAGEVLQEVQEAGDVFQEVQEAGEVVQEVQGAGEVIQEVQETGGGQLEPPRKKSLVIEENEQQVGGEEEVEVQQDYRCNQQ